MTTQAAAPPLTLKYAKTIGIVNNGFNGRGFAYPYDLAVSADGRIFVLNRWEKAPRVGICNLDEDYVDEFGGGFGKDEGQFTLPVSVAFDSEERLYVSDEYLNRVSIFNTDGELLGTWGVAGSGDGELNGPSGIAFDSDDNLYVAEQNNHRVQKFSRSRRVPRQVGELRGWRTGRVQHALGRGPRL